MAKTVFRPGEFKKSDDKVMLQLYHNFQKEEPVEVPEVVPEYTGPTADDLKREAEVFQQQWEQDKQQMLQNAKDEAERIVKEAQQAAFEEVKQQTEQLQVTKQQAEAEAEKTVHEAEKKALDIIQEAEQKRDQKLAEAYKEGYAKGSEEGFNSGKAEVDRLIDRMHVILAKTLDKRQDILNDTEQQIVELVLLMTRKVVKVISESQRNVLINNIVQALRKVKGRGDVTIRVNMADVKLTTEHTKDFMNAVESIKNITVAEDSTVDQGGCIVETDFGAIDARISSQLSELEQKILEIAPIKNVSRNNTSPAAIGDL